MSVDPRRVFVVHGRNVAARDGMFNFLRALGLQPIEWDQAIQATGKGSPYIGEILDAAFADAQAIVVLMTPDEIAYLRTEYADGDDDSETIPTAQARPNVLFEAGMAMGRESDRTILVELGSVRPFTDVIGRHAVRMDNSVSKRKALAQRLGVAGCAVDTNGKDWLSEGDLTPPAPAGGGYALGDVEDPGAAASTPVTSFWPRTRVGANGDADAILNRFELLPAQYSGKVVEVEFMVTDLQTIDAPECEALAVPPGATLKSEVRLESNGRYYQIYVSNELAEKFLALKKETLVRVRARTTYGVEQNERYPQDDNQDRKGLVVEAFLAATAPPP